MPYALDMREFAKQEEQIPHFNSIYDICLWPSGVGIPQLYEVTSTVSAEQNTRAAEFSEDIVFD